MSSTTLQAPRVAACRESDVPALMTFINDFWAKDHVLSRDEALFRWQYDSSRRDGNDSPPSVLIAWQGDRIVGMLGLTYMRWRQTGCSYLGAWNSHWFVLPEMRNSHLSLHLVRQVSRSGVEVIGSVGINATALKLLRALDYEVISEIPRWVAVVDPAKTAALIIASGITSARAEEVLVACRQRIAGPRIASEAHVLWETVTWNEELAAGWESCWQEMISPAFTGVARDSAYIRWRYIQHPSFDYQVLLARHRASGEIGGIAVFRLETVRGRSERVLRILDLLTADRSATSALLDHVRLVAGEADVAFADFYCTKSIDGLAEEGFQLERLESNPFPIPFRLQPLESGGRSLNAAIRLPRALRGSLSDILAAGALYLTKSDGDQDRPN